MPRGRERLFPLDECGPRRPKKPRRPQLEAAADPSEQVRLSRDGAGLLPGLTDGLPVRLVKPHSAKKAQMVSRDLGTVGRAMNRKWFKVAYLELFCGPGYLYDEGSGEEVPGSPLQALGIASPFDRYVFSDSSDRCCEALSTRLDRLRAELPGLPPTDVLAGDANDPAHLERVCSLIDPRSLVIAYLDPAKPNLSFATVRFLAERFRYLDLIINLPFSGIHRSLAGKGTERPSLMLDHPSPLDLLRPDDERSTADAIREHYDERLRGLGFAHITRRCVRTEPTNSPLYDIVLASRNPKAVELWEKANRAPQNPQLGLLDFDAR